MAELGAAAAVIQLLHYGTELGKFASALPGLVRRAPNKIMRWTDLCQAMLKLLEDIESRCINIDANLSILVQQCREDILGLQSMLRPVCFGSTVSHRQRLLDISFVVRKESEIQQLMLSSKSTFTMIALGVIMLSTSRLEARLAGGSPAVAPAVMGHKNRLPTGDDTLLNDLCATMTLFAASPMPLRFLATISPPDQIRAHLNALDWATNLELKPSGDLVTMHSVVRKGLREQLLTSPVWSKYQKLALEVMYVHFPTCFAQSARLQQGHELCPHVHAVLQNTMDRKVDQSTIDDVASICLRFCMYLLTVGRYARAAHIASSFQEWCQVGKISNFEMLSSLQAKEAVAITFQGDLSTSTKLHRNIYRERRHRLGKAALQTLHGLNNVAIAYQYNGDYAKAVEYHEKILTLKTSLLGSVHPDTILSWHNLGVSYHHQGQYRTAESMFKQTLSAWSKVYQPDDLFLLAARSNLGLSLFSQGRYVESEALHRHVCSERQRVLGKTHHETLKSLANLAMTLNERGYHAQAEMIYRDVLQNYMKKLGASHPDTLKMHHNLATALHDQGLYEEAEANIKSTISHLRLTYGNVHAETLEAMEFHAILLHCLEQYVAALEIAREVYEVRKTHSGFDDDNTQRSLRHVRDLAENLEEKRTMADFSTFVPIIVA
ncbi:TPR-like protein [Setomelanomma holmii]|uniref:TPR-like protein n=1 Tax=Setomelanomma holmii TaxID=210430 RepID=A0A9P4LJW2_9PLEO|nr:TPR-like protein [Setomelanomma holmii]